jgi:hypothetical protein
VLGRPASVTPEQARGEVEAVDRRWDDFGLRSILCKVLTGEAAFTGLSPGELLRKASSGDLSDAFARLAGSAADAELLALAQDCLTPSASTGPVTRAWRPCG